MSHDYARQQRAGAVLVRVRCGGHDGVGVMSLDSGERAERFVPRGGAVVLSSTAHGLARVFGPLRQEHPQLDALLGIPGRREAKRAYSASALQCMLRAPVDAWSWQARGTVLYRLDMTWTLADSMDDPSLLSLLKSDQPLGRLADLMYDSFDGDEQYREELARIDLRRAAADFEAITTRMTFEVL